MNGSEESDDCVVPRKWANKPESEGSEAESMEGRRSAKGNAKQNAVNRTQGRKESSIGLQGVREAHYMKMRASSPTTCGRSRVR